MNIPDLSTLIIIILSLSIHERAHAYSAFLLGDKTAYYAGRMSINPLRHIDPWGLVMMIIAGIGWAIPVPVNLYNVRKPLRDGLLISLAGPASNICIAYCALLLSFLMQGTVGSDIISSFLMSCVYINLGLAAFNLIPIPPLDGHRIITYLAPQFMYQIQPYGTYIFWGFVLLFIVGPLKGIFHAYIMMMYQVFMLPILLLS